MHVDVVRVGNPAPAGGTSLSWDVAVGVGNPASAGGTSVSLVVSGLASRSSLSESSAEALLRFATIALAEAFEGFVRLGV